ncbi:MAG: hypothetical protein U0263_40270 [Polyangiaceae bacterium]
MLAGPERVDGRLHVTHVHFQHRRGALDQDLAGHRDVALVRQRAELVTTPAWMRSG